MALALSVGDAEADPTASVAEWSAAYDEHFDFVWKSLRRLGVPSSALDDAAQDVFVVAFRRKGDFEGRSALKTWLFGIAWNVARNLARARRRDEEPLSEVVVDAKNVSQEEAAARAEAVKTLYEVLDGLEPEKRAVFVMAELEEMTAPEIAGVTGTPLNTVYSRLRSARADFEAGLRRVHAKDSWRQR